MLSCNDGMHYYKQMISPTYSIIKTLIQFIFIFKTICVLLANFSDFGTIVQNLYTTNSSININTYNWRFLMSFKHFKLNKLPWLSIHKVCLHLGVVIEKNKKRFKGG